MLLSVDIPAPVNTIEYRDVLSNSAIPCITLSSVLDFILKKNGAGFLYGFGGEKPALPF
jgi:hypothetical protein